MDIRPSLQVQVMIKAMEQVILPAVDPADKIAHEQAGLVLATLRILQQRMPLWRSYLRDEVKRLLNLIDDIGALEGGEVPIRGQIARLADDMRVVVDSADADDLALEEAAISMRTAVGRLMAMEGAVRPVHRTALGRLVLEASKTQLERERAWLLPFGFESDESVIAPIEQQLARVT